MQSIKSVLKVTNMIHIKDLDTTINLIVLKIDNVILLFIKKKFINMSIKNTTQYVLKKRENMAIVKTYHLNTLLIIIIY